MKLTIKTLSKSTFKVDIDMDKTVKELKETIENQEGKDYPYSAQKLIYSGKILADENKLSEYEFDEKKFIVLMITRPPPVVKPPEPETSSEKPIKEDQSRAKSSNSEDNKPKAPSTNTSTTATTTSSSTTTGASPNRTAASTNQSTLRTQPTASGTRPPQQPSGLLQAAMQEASASSMGEPNTAARLAAMMTQPQFRQMQELIQQSPHLLSSTIEALAASDPEMHSFISENPDIFVSALNHPPLTGGRTHSSRGSNTGAGQQPRQPGEHPSGARQQPVVDQILLNVSEHDKEAIERLKELGFSELAVVQAYMACDKDEQLAANLLFQMDQ